MYSLRNLSLLALLILINKTSFSAEVNVYSARQEALIKPLLDEFTKKTDIKVNLVTGKGDALLTRLINEGRNSPADVLLTVDAGRLYRAQESNVLQPVEDETINKMVPENLRSTDNMWFGLSIRARVIMFAKDRVNESELDSYESLGDEKWKGRICIRSSSNIYNQSLVAGMIAQNGLEKTENWLQKFITNFARKPTGGDRDQIKAVAAGECDIAVSNSYYLGHMLNSSDENQRLAAEKVTLFWPNQKDRGTHINISGAGITKHSKNILNAKKLIAFLASDESQRWYADKNNEFPIRDNVEVSPTLDAWGPFIADQINVSQLGKFNADAIKAMDRAGWK